MQFALGAEIYLYSQRVGDVELQTDDAHKGSAWHKVHEQVEIAALRVQALQHRAEHANVPRAARGCDFEYPIAMGSKGFGWTHAGILSAFAAGSEWVFAAFQDTASPRRANGREELMDRRRFVALIGGALAAPSLVMAQKPGKIRRIGWLGSAPAPAHVIAAFEQGLRDHGYVPGQNVVLEFRFADGRPDRVPDLAREFVRSNVDVIVVGLTPTATVAMSETQKIPIVFALGTDVVRSGLVKSLAKPGGNVTGLTWDVGGEIVAKRYELLKELAPRISRVANLWEPPNKAQYMKPIEDAASVLRLSTAWFEFSGNLERDFAEMLR